jgi:FkbM family methyltransferase
MSRPKRWIIASSALGLLLGVGVGVASYSDARVGRRIHIVHRKIAGSLPYVSWPELFKALRPGRWKQSSPPSGYFLKEKAHGEEPCSVLWETPNGAFWGQPGDDVTLQDPDHLAKYQNGPVTIRKGDIVIDCGSHIGTFSRLALERGAELVVAIEPDPISNVCFKRTFEREIAEGRVVLVEAALWDKSGTTKFVVASRSDAGSVVSNFDPRWGAVRTVDVPLTTLDETVQRLNLPRVDFIKWAIGEATRPALHGARHTLARFRPRMTMAMLLDNFSDASVDLPLVALEAVPTYNIYTRELQVTYFY